MKPNKNFERLSKIVADLELNSRTALTQAGKPFVIVENWRELGQIQEEYNRRFSKRAFKAWEPTFRACYAKHPDYASNWHPFHDLRLGNADGGGYDLPAYSHPFYEVPDGLVELSKVAEWDFEDSADTCSNCGCVIQTAPDCYAWQPDYFFFEDTEETFCNECVKEHAAEAYIQAHVNHNRLLNESILNPVKYGWTPVDELEYQNGLCGGQRDDPRKIIQLLNAINVDVFFTGSVGQFDVAFQPWVKSEDEQRAIEVLTTGNVQLPYDPATEMEKALKGQSSDYLTRTESVLPGGGLYVKIEASEIA